MRISAQFKFMLFFALSTGVKPVIASDIESQWRHGTYSIGGIGLGETARLDSHYKCEDSEQFLDYEMCSIAISKTEKGKEAIEKTSLLKRRADARVSYVNRSFEPAVFNRHDAEGDIERLAKSFGQQPHILRMAEREGLSSAVIATWGGIVLDKLSDEEAYPLTIGMSPGHGLLVDFLNDFTKSARLHLPIYRLVGEPGFVWIATFGKDGKGKLRLLTANPPDLLKDK